MKEQKHHYIPEFYLKQWADQSGRLVEYCRRHFNRVLPRLTHPGGTGYVRGLYSIKGAPPHVKDVFEDKFMMVADGIAAEALRMMIEHNFVPVGKQKRGWTRFVMSLLYRTPEGVARSYAMVQKYFEGEPLEELRKNYQEWKKPHDPDSPEEYMRMHGGRIVARTTIQHLMEIIESERVSEKIMEMQWHLGRLENLKHSLLTGDRPLIMTNGLASPESHIVMPLSPRHVWIATNRDEETSKIKAMSRTGELALRMNDRIVRQARKFVFGTHHSQLRFIERRLGEKVSCSPFE